MMIAYMATAAHIKSDTTEASSPTNDLDLVSHEIPEPSNYLSDPEEQEALENDLVSLKREKKSPSNNNNNQEVGYFVPNSFQWGFL